MLPPKEGGPLPTGTRLSTEPSSAEHAAVSPAWSSVYSSCSEPELAAHGVRGAPADPSRPRSTVPPYDAHKAERSSASLSATPQSTPGSTPRLAPPTPPTPLPSAEVRARTAVAPGAP